MSNPAMPAGPTLDCSAPLEDTPARPTAFAPQLPREISRAQTFLPPISGGTLRALKDGRLAVASDPERDQVSIVDLATASVRGQIDVGAGAEPGRIVEDGRGRVHVILRRAGALATIDPASKTLLARRDVCGAPRGVAYEPATDLLHVACATGELVSLPAEGGAVRRTLSLEPDLRDVVALSDGRLMVSVFRRAEILVVSRDGTISHRMTPPGIGRFVAGRQLTVTPAVAWRLVPFSDRAQGTEGAVLLHQRAVADEVPASMTGQSYYGSRPGCGTSIVESAVSTVLSGQEPAAAPGLIDVSLAVDVAVSARGDTIAIAVPGVASTSLPQVVVIGTDELAGESCVTARAVDGTSSARSFGPSAGSPRAGQVVAVDFLPDASIVAQTRAPSAVWIAGTNTLIPLALDARQDLGHTIFHLDAGAGVACASCHPEGGDDGRVWSFPCTGRRRTQPIRGGIGGMAPFHWAGDEPDFAALVRDVFVKRMRGPQLTADQTATLLGWIDSIPELPPLPGRDPVAVARGRATFENARVGCAACHVGERLTNNTTVDVGTGRAFQVPSLRGLAWRAPFMHDGCAATLEARFGACGGTNHGDTSGLSPAELADLVTYLESL